MKKFIKPILISAAVIATGIVVFIYRSGSDATVVETNGISLRDSASVGSDNESLSNVGSPSANRASADHASSIADAGPRSALSQELDAIQNEPDMMERPGMLYDLMHEASMEDIMELLAISEEDLNYSLGFRDDMKAAAFERWYHLDPVAALLAMDASTLSTSQKKSRMEVFLEDWAGRSPQDVAAFLEQGQLTGVSSDLTYGALVRGSAMNGNLDVVDAALDSIEDPTLKYYALKSAARVLQRDHADQFEDWLGTLSDSDQNTALAESAWMLADKDIERALAGLDQLAVRGADELPVTRLRVAVKWAENDPVRAANWVVAQDVTGEDREVLFANVMRVWVSKDQVAAVNWVESLIAKGEIDEAFMNRVAGRL